MVQHGNTSSSQQNDPSRDITIEDALDKYKPNTEEARKASEAIGFLKLIVNKGKVRVEFEITTKALVFLLTGTTLTGGVIKLLSG